MSPGPGDSPVKKDQHPPKTAPPLLRMGRLQRSRRGALQHPNPIARSRAHIHPALCAAATRKPLLTPRNCPRRSTHQRKAETGRSTYPSRNEQRYHVAKRSRSRAPSPPPNPPLDPRPMPPANPPVSQLPKPTNQGRKLLINSVLRLKTRIHYLTVSRRPPIRIQRMASLLTTPVPYPLPKDLPQNRTIASPTPLRPRQTGQLRHKRSPHKLMRTSNPSPAQPPSCYGILAPLSCFGTFVPTLPAVRSGPMRPRQSSPLPPD
jgi:hypothetical protein